MNTDSYSPLPLEAPRVGRRKTVALVLVIALVTASVIGALLFLAPLYLEKGQVCVIPGSSTLGSITCGAKTMASSPYVTSICAAGQPCIPLSFSNALQLRFNVTSPETFHLSFQANATLEVSLTCACGNVFAFSEKSFDAGYALKQGSYTLTLENHSSGPVKLSWTAYLTRENFPGYLALSNFFGFASLRFCHRRDIC